MHGKAISLPAAAALAFAGALIAAGIVPVLFLGPDSPASVLDSYVLDVIRFTLLQAALSTALSLALGVPVALALARRRFPGRDLIVRLLSLPLAIPAIVAVIGIAGIFGANGLLGGAFNLYGLPGILIAHVFFNFPMAARMSLSALDSVPAESRRLAAGLGFSDHDTWRHVDRPALMTALPGVALLVFLLCAASFTIVLTLGGGPKSTTLEVAIYQALRFDFDPARASLLALVQMALCGGLAALSFRFPMSFAALASLRRQSIRYDGSSVASKILDGIALFVGLVLLLPPLAEILAEGLRGLAPSWPLAKALATSLAIGFSAALLNIALCWPIAGLAARSKFGRRLSSAAVLAAIILPPAVIATGWFMLLNRLAGVTGLAPLLVVLLNALMALPFSYTILAPRLAQSALANDRLCASLGLDGIARFRIVDLPDLKRPLGLAFVMAAIVSLGDLTAILLFGSQDIVTLPSLIYREMGSYRMASAAGTALVLVLLAFALLALFERWSARHD